MLHGENICISQSNKLEYAWTWGLHGAFKAKLKDNLDHADCLDEVLLQITQKKSFEDEKLEWFEC